jgi:hypothetical protein
LPTRFAPLLPFALVSSFSALARAADLPDDGTHVLPCRPTVACTADIAAPGTVELELGTIHRHVVSPGPLWAFPFLAKLTLARWVQVQVGSNGFTTAVQPDTATFFDNLNVVTKLHLTDAEATGLLPSTALSAALSFPVSSDQQGYVSTFDAIFVGYVSKDLGPIHADANAGVELWQLDGAVSPQAYGTLALSTSLPFSFGVMAEGYYFSDASPVATRDGGFLCALSYSPRPWLTFDAGGDVGFFPSVRTFSAFVGMTVAPVVLWK